MSTVGIVSLAVRVRIHWRGESVIANVGTYTCSCAELDLRAVVVPSLMAAMNDIIRLGKLLRQSIDRLMPEREAILLPLTLG